MDEGTISAAIETAKWLVGGFGTIIILLLSIIAYFIKHGQDKIEIRLTDHDNKFYEQQNEIHELAKNTEKTLAVIQATMKKKG